MKTERTKPRRVNPFTEANDFTAALMGDLGFSTHAVVEMTGLTKSQVGYRLNKFGIKRANYRNGVSLGARVVLQRGRSWIGYALERELRDRMGR